MSPFDNSFFGSHFAPASSTTQRCFDASSSVPNHRQVSTSEALPMLQASARISSTVLAVSTNRFCSAPMLTCNSSTPYSKSNAKRVLRLSDGVTIIDRRSVSTDKRGNLKGRIRTDEAVSRSSVLASCSSLPTYPHQINHHNSTSVRPQCSRPSCFDDSLHFAHGKRYASNTCSAYRSVAFKNEKQSMNACSSKKQVSLRTNKYRLRNPICTGTSSKQRLRKPHSYSLSINHVVHKMWCNLWTTVSQLSTLLRFWLISFLLLSFCGNSVHALRMAIPHCADIDYLEETFNFETSSLNDLLLCFCKVKNDSNVAISCLYGSSLDDLSKAISLVAAANATVDEIMLSHVEFNETGLPDDFFNRNATRLKILSIGLCAQPGALRINVGSMRGLEEILEHLALTDCNIDEVPVALRSLTALRTLSLARNRITSIAKSDIASHKKLQSLNLAGNFINSMEEGTLGQISDTLETFIIGEHNFINESIFNEIAQLHNVKVGDFLKITHFLYRGVRIDYLTLQMLDLSKADGISDFPDGMFEQLINLQRLNLMGCSLTTITNQTFRGLNNLTELDLRVNLIREVNCDAFKWLSNVRRLSLAGNYLNSTEACIWRHFDKIEELDLSWNELSDVQADTFAPMGPTLKVLNLRHNTNLSQLDENAFRNLTNLRRLNLSDTAITHIDRFILAHLTSLEALDMSGSHLASMDQHSLDAQSKTLNKLALSGNLLTALPATLLSQLHALKEVDLSSNPWLCDTNIKSVVDEINKKYTLAAQLSSEFSLKNANMTTCDRPYSLRGEVITDVDPKLLVEYDQAIDTTTAKPTTTTTAANDTDDATEPFTFLPKESIIGVESKDGFGHSQTATHAPPEYDINARQTINDNSNRQFIATLTAFGVMGAISIAVTIAVVMYIKKRKSDHSDAIADMEMDATR
uniref:LRRCT domain-containing protein n=1 Tax=Ascaris lumbricoides TaxID=6252 RepID=A0A9J2PCT8_ASCLU